MANESSSREINSYFEGKSGCPKLPHPTITVAKKRRRNLLIKNCSITKAGKPLKSMMVLKSFHLSVLRTL